MGARRVSLVDLGRAVGDGWCAFGRGAVRGEALLVPSGGLGIGGEPFPDMNFGYVFGPDGVGEAVRHVEHEYVVERASDVDGVMDAADVLGDAYEIPPEWVRSLLGPTFPDVPSADVSLTRREGRALAAAGSGRSGSTVGIYAVGTRQAHRRRGAAAAAVSAALDHHVRTGAHLFGLLSDSAAEPLYASLGFAVVDHAQMWRVEGP